MNMRKILTACALVLVLCVAVRTAWTDQTSQPLPPPPMHGISGICSDDDYIYVMAGGKIMQYGLTDLTLQKTVELPKPSPPTEAPPEGTEPPQFPPPHGMDAPHGLWVGNGFLYVLAGPVVYRYSTSDLTTIQATLELPKP
jgi:hypothetical protein